MDIRLSFSMKLLWQEFSWLCDKLLFCYKAFAVACGGPMDFACDGDY